MNKKIQVRKISYLELQQIFVLELFSKFPDEMQDEVIELMKDLLSR